jgi:two-component system cell cycle response regulator
MANPVFRTFTAPAASTPLLPGRPAPAGKSRATVTLMSGAAAGCIVPLGHGVLVIGCDAESDLCLDDPGVSRRHARIARSPEGGFYVEDLGSTNGTQVHGRRVTLTTLESGDYIQLGSALLRFEMLVATDEAVRRQLYEESTIDPLTHVYNRRYFFRRLEAEVVAARRTDIPLSVLMIDVDEFKHFNVTFGHMPGDRALCFVAAQVLRRLGPADTLARYGGEEFVVLLPGSTHAEAMRTAEHIRRDIATLRFAVSGNSVSLTVSVGVASLDDVREGEDGDDGVGGVVRLADERLYEAKQAGRNVVHGG